MSAAKAIQGPGLRRQIARTVLLVGEGDSEVQWLQHVKGLYVVRGCGLAVTIKNARGKGAAHVVDVTIRQSLNAAFDVKGALLDTDTDWTEKTKAKARKNKVQVIAAEPCLEGFLLMLHGRPVDGRSSAQLKRDFLERFGTNATQADVYVKHFGKNFLDAGRVRIPQLELLLGLLNR